MVPRPGETADEMWQATAWQVPRHEESGAIGLFYHDVDPALAAEALSRERRQSETTSREPWPLPAWPDLPTHFMVCRDDRFFPADWLRGVVHDRLGIEPDELACGHTPALSRPRELVELMESYPPSPSMCGQPSEPPRISRDARGRSAEGRGSRASATARRSGRPRG